jgi:hypothetical protein
MLLLTGQEALLVLLKPTWFAVLLKPVGLATQQEEGFVCALLEEFVIQPRWHTLWIQVW